MIIYSWNMLYRNEELERAFHFISSLEFDLFCLQEVPESFVPRLLALPYFSSSNLDTEKVSDGVPMRMYHVILSKFPIKNKGEVTYTDRWTLLPFRTRAFVALMKPFHFSKVTSRGGMYIDIDVLGEKTRVFSLHLALAYPKQRFLEFKEAMAHYDDTAHQIICGDFNIVEFPHVTLLNWLLGGPVLDALLFKRERHHVEKMFNAHGFQNPLVGHITHPFSQSQLDHILVPHTFSPKSVAVLSDRFGSDHAIVRVEV